MEKLSSQLLSQRGLVLKNCKNVQPQLSQMLYNGKTERQVYGLAKKMMTQSLNCKMCLRSRMAPITNLHRPFKHLVMKYTNYSRQLPAVASFLLRSPAFSNLVNSQVQQLQRFHTAGGMKLDRERHSSHDNRDQHQNDENKDDDNKQDPDYKRLWVAAIYMAVITVITLMLTPNQSSSHAYISWNEFYHNILLKGEVKSIHLWRDSEDMGNSYAVIEVHEGAVIKGQLSSPTRYIVEIPRGFRFEEKVRELEDAMGLAMKDRIPITYGDTSQFSTLLFVLLIGVAVAAYMAINKLTKSSGGNVNDVIDRLSGGIRQAKFTRVDIASRGAKAVSFKDVAGLKEAKVEITEFVDYLTNPQRYQKLGAKTPRGALLLGPPGCGKTLLARALATEAKVPFLAMAGSEFVEMIGGVGAARVRSLFKEARARAPCIIYIDEIDAIGRSRGGSASAGGEDEHTLNQLLVEMDGIGTQEGVILIAATNRADILDKALLRPGRFDRHVMIDLPTLQEREEIFMVYLNKLKLAKPASVYAKPLSKLTPGMSGADINNICNEAAIHAARDSNKVIDKKDFEYAVERVIAGVEKKTSQVSPAEKKVVAYHESGHALVGWMLEHTDALLRISILPRTNSRLGFTQYMPSDQRLYSQEQLFERMCMALGGRAAESLVFNHVSSGAHDDLNRVTQMAYDQIRSYGMNARVGHLSFPSEKEQQGQRPYSQRLAQIMDEEARSLVAKAFLHTQTVLQENRDKLNKLATTLLEKEVLDYDDIAALIGAPPYGTKNKIEPEGWRGMESDTQDSDRLPKKPSRQKRK